MDNTSGKIKALSKSPSHTLVKKNVQSLTFLSGLGLEGDAHLGVSVKHRSRVEMIIHNQILDKYI